MISGINGITMFAFSIHGKFFLVERVKLSTQEPFICLLYTQSTQSQKSNWNEVLTDFTQRKFSLSLRATEHFLQSERGQVRLKKAILQTVLNVTGRT